MGNVHWVACLMAVAMSLVPLAGRTEEDPTLSIEAAVEFTAQGHAVAAALVRAQPPSGADPDALCVFFHQRGVAAIRLGRYGQAKNDLREALRLNRRKAAARDEWCLRWRITGDLQAALSQAGDVIGALEVVEARIGEFPQSRTTLMVARGEFECDLGLLADAERSLAEARAALQAYRNRSSPREVLVSGWQIGIETLAARLQELRGNGVEGERLRRLALQHAQETSAIADRMEPDAAWRRRIAPAELARAMLYLADNLVDQGRFGEAELRAREHFMLISRQNAPPASAMARALRTIGMLRLQQGRLADAERWLGLALRAMERIEAVPHSIQLARMRASLATVHLLQGRSAEAIALFEARAAGLRSDTQQEQRIGVFHIDWALAELGRGRPEVAARQLRRLIDVRLARPFAAPVEIAQLRGLLGVALAAGGDDAGAGVQFREALPPLQARAETAARTDSGGYVDNHRLRIIVDGYLDWLARCRERDCKATVADPAAEAFRLADVARSSSVQRALATSVARASLPDAALRELARSEQSATQRLYSLTRILERLSSLPPGRRLDKVSDDLRRDIAQLEAQIRAHRRELSERFPHYATLVSPPPARLADVQRGLAVDEAMVAFYVAERETHVWTLTRDQAAWRVVPLGRAALAREVTALLAQLELDDGRPRPFDVARAHGLYQQLLARDAALWRNARWLNVIPHGPLGQLPLGLLPTAPSDTPAMARQPWLIRQLAIAQAPSANAWIALRQQVVAAAPQRSLIGFGDPLFEMAGRDAPLPALPAVRASMRSAARDDLLEAAQRALADGQAPRAAMSLPASRHTEAFSLLPQLPDTAVELREIAEAVGARPDDDLYIGARATEKNIKSQDLSRYRIIAIATHGLVGGEVPGIDQPALALSNPELTGDVDNDGFLTLEEILGLQLNADWVVLSACNTAGADGAAGEALSGLGRAFFYAGARSLLVSHWPVETVSARLLTTGLFRAQAVDRTLGRAEALRASMLSLMQARPAYAHPVYWAPFSLVGDSGTR